MLKFKKENPFLVLETDKKVGLCIIPHSIHKEIVDTLLSDTIIYKKLDSNPLNSLNNNIKTFLDELLITKNISKRLHSKLFINNSKLAVLRLLPKLHKSKFGGRLIINCKNYPTSNIALLIDLILQPFIKTCDSFLLDSQNLIQDTKNLFFNINSKLVAADFENLFPNIDPNDALTKISDFISSNFNSNEITSFAFHNLLKFIFENNFFSYLDLFFQQIKGVAMGSKCAPSIANLYLSILEKSFIFIHKPIFYKRYVDDIFIIVDNYNFDINILLHYFGLKLNITSHNLVNFLDLNISLNTITNKLEFSLYIKPTQTFSYLLNESCHPNFIFKNIPKSLFFRIRRICSSIIDYYFFARKFHSQLLSRGYDSASLNKCIRMIGDLNRDDIINYKTKNAKTFDFKSTLFFKIPFNFNFLNLEKTFSDSFNIIKNNNNSLSNIKFNLINSMNFNLSQLLVHGAKMNTYKKYNYTKCNKKKCITCSFANINFYLNLNNFSLPILSNSSCSSKNVVYILNCIKCNIFYIGQSNNFERRFKEHYYTSSYNNEKCKKYPIHIHFNSSPHNIKRDLRFLIFKTNLDDKNTRLNIENQIIHLFIILNMKIINEEIPDLYSYKNMKLF